METHSALERLKTTIHSFACSDQPGAMLVHGPWGVGKTYGVLAALKAKDESEQMPFSYVSLYGISSLDDIYLRLSLGWVNKVSQKAPAWLSEKLKTPKGATAIERITGTLGSLGAIFLGKDKVSAISASAAGLLTSKMLIVLDDLERKSPNLTIQAILGVVSYLVESRECRVIFITNDEEVKGDEKQIFDANKEKVFDFEVPYSPTVEENTVIFAANYQDFLLQTLLALRISNLRVIRRTVRVLETLDSKIPKDCIPSRNSILNSAAIICCLYFGFREKVNLDRMKNTSSLEIAMYLDAGNAEGMALSEGDKLIVKSRFREGPCDDFLIEVIKTGETNWIEFERKVQEMQIQHEELQANSTIEQKLRSLFQNYSSNKPDITQNLKSDCEKKLLLLSPGTIDWAGQVLVELGEPDFREEWFKKWASENIKKFSDKDIRDVLNGVNSMPKQLKEAFRKEAECRQPELDMEKVLFALATNEIISNFHIDQIAQLPVDRYISWLRVSNSQHIRDIVTEIFSAFYGIAESKGVIAQKILEAIDKLAEESKLNAIRANYYKKALQTNVTP